MTTTRKAIHSHMMGSGNMNKPKCEQQNACNPSIDGRIGLEIRVIDHTLDVFCVHLHC